MNIYWRAVEFVKSRTGKYVAFSGLAVIAFVLVGEWREKKGKEAGDKVAALPRLPSKTLWDSESTTEDGKGESRQDSFQASESREDYRPFRPEAPQSEQVEIPKSPKTERAVIKPEFFASCPSLIKFERQVEIPEPSKLEESDSPNHEKPIELEQGRLLHGQLLATVSSSQGGSMVLAQLTRSLVDEGLVLLPAGTRLFGKLAQTTKTNRMLFDETWLAVTPTGERVEFSAELQENGFSSETGFYAVTDGQLGLPGILINETNKNFGKELLGKTVSAIGRLSQENVRTLFGEQVPATARNIVLEGGSVVVDHYVDRLKSTEQERGKEILVEAGRGFYLMTRNLDSGVEAFRDRN